MPGLPQSLRHQALSCLSLSHTDCWLWQTAVSLSESALPGLLRCTLCLPSAQVAADKHQTWCAVLTGREGSRLCFRQHVGQQVENSCLELWEYRRLGITASPAEVGQNLASGSALSLRGIFRPSRKCAYRRSNFKSHVSTYLHPKPFVTEKCRLQHLTLSSA